VSAGGNGYQFDEDDCSIDEVSNTSDERNMTAMRKPMLMTDEADVDDSDGDEDANKANHHHKEPQSSRGRFKSGIHELRALQRSRERSSVFGSYHISFRGSNRGGDTS